MVFESNGIRIAVDDRRCEMEFVDSAEIETTRWLNRDRCDRNARRDVVQIGNRVWKAVRVKADAGENERRILRPAIRALRELHAVEDVDDRLGEDDLRQDIERHAELIRFRHELLRDPVGSHALQAHAVAAAFRDNEERRFRYHRRAGLERIHDSRFDRILSGCRRRVRVGDDEIHQRRFAERLIVSLDLELFAVDGRARDFTRCAALELEADHESGVGCGDSIDIDALQIVRQPHHPNLDLGRDRNLQRRERDVGISHVSILLDQLCEERLRIERIGFECRDGDRAAVRHVAIDSHSSTGVAPIPERETAVFLASREDGRSAAVLPEHGTALIDRGDHRPFDRHILGLRLIGNVANLVGCAEECARERNPREL